LFGGMFGGGMGGMGGMGGDFQAAAAGMLNDPEAMQAMMDSPLMQSIMSNPDLMRSMLEANPATASLLRDNPELSRALTDPDMMRTMSQAARNPAYMRELMRSSDRQLANIESLPGGFNALRRMYETVGEPLERSLMEGMAPPPGEAGEATGAAAAGAPSAPNSEGLPNPWARRAPAAGAAAGACCGGVQDPAGLSCRRPSRLYLSELGTAVAACCRCCRF
jgi:ubiquilin